MQNKNLISEKWSGSSRRHNALLRKRRQAGVAALTLMFCFMGTPHSAFGQAGLPTPVVTLTSSPNPSKLGESVSFTATVSSPGGPTPGGYITVSEYPVSGGPAIIYGTVTLTNGVGVVITNALTEGTHTIWATYGGEDSVYQGAQSSVSQVVNAANPVSSEPLRRVVPVHLDVTTGDITVGSKVYPAGAGPGMHLIALNRTPDPDKLDAPDLIQDGTFHDASSANEFLENVLADAPDTFLIVNAAGNYGFALNAVAKNLEKFGAQNDIEGVNSAIAFVLLGNGGRKMGQALQRGYSARNVDGYLAEDSNGKYTFIQPDYVRYDITTDGTIKIGSTAYTVDKSNRQPGCDGANAFHLMVVNREDPGAVIANNSYCTAQSDSEITRFWSDLERLLGNEGLLFFIASNGHPIPANWDFYNCTNPPATCQGADGDRRIQRLGNDIARLGGYFETMVYLTPKDTYSLVGAPPPPTGTPGAANRARESSSVYPDHPTGELHGELARGLRGTWYSPLDADLTGLANLDFYQILAQIPVPFPHPANAQELAAFQSISTELCGDGCNVRNQYANTNAAIDNYYSTLLHDQRDCLTDTTSPFCVVRQQLLTEFKYVQNIQNFNDNLTTLWSTQGTITIFSLLKVSNTIIAELPKPDPAASTPNLVEPIVSFFLGLASELPIPYVNRIAGIADTAFNFATSLTTDKEGNEAISLTSTVAEVADQAAAQFTDQGTTLGTQFDFIYQDWGKIQALGTALAHAQPDTAWYWDTSATGRILQAMRPAIEESYYRTLMPAVYAIGSYVPNCNLCLAPSNGWGTQPIWQQPRAYTVNDPDCGVCGNQGLHKVNPFYLNYPPYTFPTDSDNPYQDPNSSDYTQGTPTLLASGSWLAAGPRTDPANAGYYGLYDPGRTLVKLLPHLFTPKSDGGLGVYRPAFFESWPFPRVACGWSDNGSGMPGPGCNWGAAAPSPDAVPEPVTDVSIGPGSSKEKFAGRGQIQVPLSIINNGTLELQSIQIDNVSLRTLAGSGEADLADPLLPIKRANLAPGNSATVNLIITVPPGIEKLAVTEEVTVSNGEVGPPTHFAFGQVIFPHNQQ